MSLIFRRRGGTIRIRELVIRRGRVRTAMSFRIWRFRIGMLSCLPLAVKWHRWRGLSKILIKSICRRLWAKEIIKLNCRKRRNSKNLLSSRSDQQPHQSKAIINRSKANKKQKPILIHLKTNQSKINLTNMENSSFKKSTMETISKYTRRKKNHLSFSRLRNRSSKQPRKQ